MDFQKLIQQIHHKQLETFCCFDTYNKVKYCSGSPKNQRGLYWIWTNMDIQILAESVKPPIRKEVPIKKLIEQRKDLKNICTIKNKEFQIVYNGVGGYNKAKPIRGLRNRIKQEFKGNGETVGSLNIDRHKLNAKWAISFFDFELEEHKEIIKDLPMEQNLYKDYAKDFEMLWRLEYGTPILCRH